MENNQIEALNSEVQVIIDLIAAKENKEANNKLTAVSATLDDLLDHSDDDDDLMEISRYQVLLNQLFQKINSEIE